MKGHGRRNLKAVVKYAPGKGNVELRDVEEPTPGPHQVKVEVKAAGVCGSDIHIYHDDIKLLVRPPVVMGHEFAGVIAELGEGVQGLHVGDRITCETAAYVCGECLQCRMGNYNICPEKKLIGYVFNGCFAKYCLVDEGRVHLLPDNVDFVAGALSEPLACCVHALLELTCISAGDVVVITGPGPIGLLCLQLVKAEGGYAIVCGTSQDGDRLKMAHRLGADVTVNVESQDVLKLVEGMTNSQGADVFLECSGVPAAARLGLDVTRRGGQYTQIGLFSGPFEVDLSLVAYKELKVTGSLGQKWTAWKRGLTLLSQGKVDTKSLVTHILPLTQWREAFQIFEEKNGLKIVLQPVD
jgi:L-iditol 2-dehydrogenase